MRQVELARRALLAGAFVYGSCWGLQVAATACGGRVFPNPRGRELREVQVVQQVLGCLLECIDPNSTRQRGLVTNNQLRGEANLYMNRWRQAASAFIASNPSPNTPSTLGDFVLSWQNLTPQGQMNWPDEWPLLELCFKLITWLPGLQDDPEGQTYLEAIARCISA